MEHEFNPEKEPGTVQIEINRDRYVRIKVGKESKVYSQVPIEEIVRKDNKTIETRRSWDIEGARLWVPPRIAERLTKQSINEQALGIPPTARIVGNRTIEEAVGKVAGPVRKKPD